MNRPTTPTPPKRARRTLAFLRAGSGPADEQTETKVLGPYRDRDKWRLIVVKGITRKSLNAESEQAAEHLKAELSRAIVERTDCTIGELLSDYEAYLTTERGSRPTTPTPRKLARRTLAFLRAGSEPSNEKIETKVSGPYRDRGKWRLVVFDGITRKSVIAESQQEAERLKAELSRAIVERADRTIGELLPDYEAYLTIERGTRGAPMRRRKMEQFLGVTQTLGGLTPQRAATMYAAECQRVTRLGRPSAAAAHRFYLAEAKRFFKWAVSRGFVSSNPFADVRPVGRPKVGKMQLRIDEARRFVDVALAAAQRGEPMPLAALLALILGARANEVLQRQARDVDDGAAILWIPSGKTENAKRRLTIPLALRPMVAKLVEGKPSESYLFASRRDRSKPYSDTRLWQRVGQLCEQANVPRVCTHSLRGLHATLSVSAGMSSEHVAASLGHASFSTTARHYADASAIANRKTQEVTGALFGSKPTVAELVRLASMLSQAEREELRAALPA